MLLPFLRLGSSRTPGDEIPVYQLVAEELEARIAPIPVVQVVGALPNVNAQQRQRPGSYMVAEPITR
jgi:hypothetical protein